jgi:hypothetical protein
MRKSQPSKRRWIARVKAGKWVPKQVVFFLDARRNLGDLYESHPIESGFMRLREPTPATPATPAEEQKDQ